MPRAVKHVFRLQSFLYAHTQVWISVCNVRENIFNRTGLRGKKDHADKVVLIGFAASYLIISLLLLFFNDGKVQN